MSFDDLESCSISVKYIKVIIIDKVGSIKIGFIYIDLSMRIFFPFFLFIPLSPILDVRSHAESQCIVVLICTLIRAAGNRVRADRYSAWRRLSRGTWAARNNNRSTHLSGMLMPRVFARFVCRWNDGTPFTSIIDLLVLLCQFSHLRVTTKIRWRFNWILVASIVPCTSVEYAKLILIEKRYGLVMVSSRM
jgi:hypothetical protein